MSFLNNHFIYRSRAVLLLTLAYLALTANIGVSNIIMGVILSLGVLFIVKPDRKTADATNLPRAIVGLVIYIGHLTIDLIGSGFQVAKIVLSRDIDARLKQGIIAIPSDCESNLGQALSVHAITVTPGEMVVEVGRDGTMYTHCLDVTHSAQYVVAAQKRREALLRKIFI